LAKSFNTNENQPFIYKILESSLSAYTRNIQKPLYLKNFEQDGIKQQIETTKEDEIVPEPDLVE